MKVVMKHSIVAGITILLCMIICPLPGYGQIQSKAELEKSIANYHALVERLDGELTNYRDSMPGFHKFADASQNPVIPMIIEGEIASISLEDARFQGLHNYEKAKLVREGKRKLVEQIVASIYRDIYQDFDEAIRTGNLRYPNEQDTMRFKQMLEVFTKYDEMLTEPWEQYYPYEEGTIERNLFLKDLGEALMIASSPLGKMVYQLPSDIAEHKREADDLYDRLVEQNSQRQMPLPLPERYREAYLTELEKASRQIGVATRTVAERRKLEREGGVVGSGLAVSYGQSFKELYEELGAHYPMFELKGIDWQEVGSRLLPQAAEVETEEAFGLLCLQLVAALKDSHSHLQKGILNPPRAPLPRYDPGFACLIDDRGLPVVYYVDRGSEAQQAGIEVGMTVTEVNETSAKEALAEYMQLLGRYYGYSSQRYLEYDAARGFIRQQKQGDRMMIRVKTADGFTRTFRGLAAKKDIRYLPRLPVPIEGINDSANVDWTILDSNIGYIYVRRIRNGLNESLDQAVAELKDVDGLIIDVRGNSGGGFDGTRAHRNFKVDDLEEPDRPRYGGPIAVLLDARCLSAGEGWASWFVASERGKTFGQATAGASSAKTHYTMTNGLFKVTYSNRARRGYLDRAIEYVGLEPEVEVMPNAKDLAEGRDTVLEAAKKYLAGHGGIE